MNKYIEVNKHSDKLIIKLANPPVNAESTAMLEEMMKAVKKVEDKIIVIWGSCTTSKGSRIFSAGGDLGEIKKGKAYKIAKLISNIGKSLLDSNNYVVTIMGGDAVGGGWGMPFDVSDTIYYLKGSSLVAGFTRNGITPGCGISLLINTLGSSKAYKFLMSEKHLSLDNLERNCPNIFRQFKNIQVIPDIIKKIKKGKKLTPYVAYGVKLNKEDKLSSFINEVIENPKKARSIQLRYLKMSLEEDD